MNNNDILSFPLSSVNATCFLEKKLLIYYWTKNLALQSDSYYGTNDYNHHNLMQSTLIIPKLNNS